MAPSSEKNMRLFTNKFRALREKPRKSYFIPCLLTEGRIVGKTKQKLSLSHGWGVQQTCSLVMCSLCSRLALADHTSHVWTKVLFGEIGLISFIEKW